MREDIQSLFDEAVVLRKQRKIIRSRDVLLSLCDVAPDKKLIKNELAAVYRELGEYANSIKTSETILAVDSSFKSGHLQLITTHLFFRKYQDGLVAAESALKLFPTDQGILNQYAKALRFSTDLNRAKSKLLLLCEKYPNHCEIHNQLAIVFRELGEYENSIKTSKAILAVDYSFKSGHLQLITTHLFFRKYQDGLVAAESALKLFPTDQGILNQYAKALRFSTDLNRAKSKLLLLCEKYPNHCEIHNQLAIVFRELGEYENSIKTSETILAVDYSFKSGHLQLIATHLFFRKYQDGLVAAESALKLFPTDQGILNQYAKALRFSTDLNRAKSKLLLLCEKYPNHCEIHNQLAIVFRELGEYENSIKTSETILAVDSSFKSGHLQLITTHLFFRKYQDGLVAAESALKLFPTDQGILNQYAKALRFSTDLNRAKSKLLLLCEKYPNHCEIHNQLAIVFRELGEYENSIKTSETILAVDFRFKSGHLQLIATHLFFRKYQDGLVAAESALKLFPTDQGILNQYAKALRFSTDLNRAKSKLLLLCEKYPNHCEIHNQLAIVFRELGEYENSIKTSETILAVDFRFKSGHLQLIATHLFFEKYPEGLVVAESAIKLFPTDQGILIQYVKALRFGTDLNRAKSKLLLLCEKYPNSCEIQNQLAIVFRELGEYENSIKTSETILAVDSSFKSGYLQLIATHLFFEKYPGGLVVAESAIKLFPTDQGILNQYAKALRFSTDLNRAKSKLLLLCEKYPNHCEIQNQLAIVFRELGEYENSIKTSETILAVDSSLKSGYLQLIATHLFFEKYPEGLVVAESAIKLFPTDQGILNQYLKASRCNQQLQRARSTLIEACNKYPERSEIKNLLAVVLLELGSYSESLSICQAIIDGNYSFYPAHYTKLDVLAAVSNHEELNRCLIEYNRQFLSTRFPLMGRLAITSLAKLLLLNPAEALRHDFIIELVNSNMHQLSLAQVLLVLQSTLLMPAKQSRLVDNLFNKLFNPNRFIPSSLCIRMIDILHSEHSQNWLDVSRRIVKLAPFPDHGYLNMYLMSLLTQFDQALSKRKELLPSIKCYKHVQMIVRLLSLRGSTQIAARYMRLLAKSSANDFRLTLLRVRVFSDANWYQNACDELRNFMHANDNMSLACSVQVINALVHLHLLPEACDLCKQKLIQYPQSDQLILLNAKLHISFHGSLPENFSAESLITKLSTIRNSHFRTSFEGSILNDLNLSEVASKSDQGQFYSALSTASPPLLLKSLSLLEPSSCNESPIPPVIYQYWDKKNMPNEINQICQSWKSIPGFSYALYNRFSALELLRQELGADWAYALQRANSSAEQADFFRLCILVLKGGFYADCDDRYLGHIEDLRASVKTLTFFVEPYGFTANNFIIAPKGHPLLLKMALFAKQSLLSRDDDNVWQKTGPGLVSRVIYQFLLANPGRADSHIQLVSRRYLHKFVQFHVPLPYKKTNVHWSKKGNEASLSNLISSVLV